VGPGAGDLTGTVQRRHAEAKSYPERE